MISPIRKPKGITMMCIALLGSLSLAAQAIVKSTPTHSSSELKNTPQEIQSLTIGDKVPDIIFENVLNYKSKKAKLSDFRGKLVILDMWSTWCTSCIEAFPKMEELQDKFKDRVQILLVNPYDSIYDSDVKIAKVLNRMKVRTGFYPTLPIPVHDTILNHYFPHQSVPHFILIDPQGILIGITYKAEITEENINAILSGKKIHIPVKNDWAYDKEAPLFVNGNGGDGSDFIYRSIFTNYKEGLGSYIGRTNEKDGKVSRFYVINYPLLSLFQIAYSNVFKFPLNRLVIEVKNPSIFQATDNIAALHANTFCYEVIAPKVTDEEMTKYMQDDLFRNFRAVAKNEIRTVECYQLVTNDQVRKPITNRQISETDIEKNSLKKYIQNEPVARLIGMLNSIFVKPVIDETKLTKNISINFPIDIYDYDLTKWKNFLSKNGFDLVETKRKLEVAVITDK